MCVCLCVWERWPGPIYCQVKQLIKYQRAGKLSPLSPSDINLDPNPGSEPLQTQGGKLYGRGKSREEGERWGWVEGGTLLLGTSGKPFSAPGFTIGLPTVWVSKVIYKDLWGSLESAFITTCCVTDSGCVCVCQELVVVRDTVGKAQSLSKAHLPPPLTSEVQ